MIAENLRTPAISSDLVKLYERDAQNLLKLPMPGQGMGAIDALDVLRAHYVVVDFCLSEKIDEGIGGIGPKNPMLLMSAIDRQFAQFEGQMKWSGMHEQLATLIFGLVKNHPFHDANKRTALLTLVYGFYLNSHYFEADKSDVEDLLVYIASNSLHLFENYDEFVGRPDADVCFIADYLKRNTRRMDKRMYLITYRELDRKLRQRGFGLECPDKNYIDVVEYSPEHTSVQPAYRRVIHVAFPGWSRQVAKGDIRKILGACDLTPEQGIDAQVFFYDEDPIYFLTSDYRSQIFSLAYR